jgi:hypothetical protein
MALLLGFFLKLKLFFASNRGASEPFGLFGCLIVNKKNIQVEGSGQVCGANPQLF